MTLDPEHIVKMIDQFEEDADSIRQEAIKMTWYMRGGLSYNDALNLSVAERKMIGGLIKENLETTKKSGLPFF